jgi:hypothetical protein
MVRVTPIPSVSAGLALPDAIARLLARPDLQIAPHERSIVFAPDLAAAFQVDPSGHVRLGPSCLARTEAAAALMRHALELAMLLPRMPDAPALAGLAAARVAAVFARVHGVDDAPWHAAFAAASMDPAAVRAAWAVPSAFQAGVAGRIDAATLARLEQGWALLGPAEALLQSGGDARLRVDPATGLNHYGCSHRPRPWAVTFASSTASSSSERGFAAAEAVRQGVTLAVLAGDGLAELAREAASVRQAIGRHAGLGAGGGVVLAASGTDCELFALALGVADPERPVTNVLIAPDETGSGVPLAASGCHFAADTARGALVRKGESVAGTARDAVLARVAARGADGALLPADAIDAACADAVEAAVAGGRQVILHVLDISKTGYLAPSVTAAAAIAARHGPAVTVVVDACQLRLSAESLRGYLDRGWMVLITGSKFLTGPPFAGAVLLPAVLAGRMRAELPAGFADYSSRPEWPDDAATSALPDRANYGLLLRWRAALAEWDALAGVAAERRREILTRFCARVRQGIDDNPDVALVETPPPARDDDGWDGIQTIIGFVVRPADPLDPEQARRAYHWLNADLRAALPPTLSAEQERLACLRCHIGQPVPLPGPGGRTIGVLRISAGARLVSGEPSHHDLDEDARLLREIRDALSVLGKLSLILAHWDALCAADPPASF